MALKAYKREVYCHVDNKKDILIHTDESVEDETVVTDELLQYDSFDDFDDFFEFFKKHRGMMNIDVGMSCVKLDIWSNTQTISKRNFKPCSILVKYEEIELRFKDLLDIDANKAIQYIKERWNNEV